VLGARTSVLPVVAHESPQLAQGKAGFFMHADEQGRRYGKSALSDLANLRRINIKPRRKLPIVSGAQQVHEGIKKYRGIIVRIVVLHCLVSELVHISSDSESSCSHGALALRRRVSSSGR